MNRRALVALGAILTAAALTSCGIQPESSPTAIDRPFRPTTSSSLTPDPPGAVRETLYLVRDGSLVAVNRYVSQTPTVEDLLADLRSGPTDEEHRSGLTSALIGANLVASVRLDGTQAVVELAAPVDGTARTDDQLAFAQLVCTLTMLSGVETVMFTHENQPIGVPRGDGSVSTGPLTGADYATMMELG
ncbi:GerMN domain-containing protein [Luedemannella helvata]|uniref:GerMN domain-containing protein n=1 Tax=Luedemannella helvata TaxID=349315 RepID=A0ABN2L670_9ACTN